ncbi:MAG: cation diffusion facilitator family transporter [Oscillospiraceae bacterium]|jgi:cation diffusion facilitator family transporter|nr:cation diffusion facilitator family transporter [Oscillospiraceae bacterium]
MRNKIIKNVAIFGLSCNIILFVFKLTVGNILNSMAVISDGFNNLSDVGSSIVILISIKLACACADKEHPQGHGRIEYITALIISVILVMFGLNLGTGSVKKIISPQAVDYSPMLAVILFAAVLIKGIMFVVYRHFGKTQNSDILKVIAFDSISDVVSTLFVITSLFFHKYNIDGYAALLVAIFIIVGGVKTAYSTVNKLIGTAPTDEVQMNIQKILSYYPDILGYHDLELHDYGIEKFLAYFHVELSPDIDFLKSHEIIDSVERDIETKLNIKTVIHADPLLANNN